MVYVKYDQINPHALLLIRWQDYEANLGSGFRELRKDNEFFDVTLCCDNGVDKVQAHKLILVSNKHFYSCVVISNLIRNMSKYYI